MNERRTEFGAERSVCDCINCKRNCKFMPGYLIPADLERMIPADCHPLEWAEKHLLASPGAKVMRNGQMFNIPTLVPATVPTGGCVFLAKDDHCNIHAVSPFGCAFFDCKTTEPRAQQLSSCGLTEIINDARTNGLYWQIWNHLNDTGFRSMSAAAKRAQLLCQELPQ